MFVKRPNPIPYRAASAVKVNVLLADKLNQWHQIKYDVWKRHDCNAPKIHSYFIRLDMKSLNTDKLGTITGASRTMNNSFSHFLITIFDIKSALTPIGTHLHLYAVHLEIFARVWWKRHDCNAPKIHSYFIRLDMKSLNTDKLGTIKGASRMMNNSSTLFLITLFDLIRALTPIGTHLVNYIYCKFGNFREGFIFMKLCMCEVSWK